MCTFLPTYLITSYLIHTQTVTYNLASTHAYNRFSQLSFTKLGAIDALAFISLFLHQETWK